MSCATLTRRISSSRQSASIWESLSKSSVRRARRRACQNTAHGFDHFRLAHGFHQRAAGFGRHVELENSRETLIGEEQALRSIHYRDAFDHAAENRGRKVALFGERANGAVQALRRLIERNAELFKSIAR